MNNMFTFNEKYYYIDLDAMFALRDNGSLDGSKNVVSASTQKEISNTYEIDEEGTVQLTQKIVHEVITPKDEDENDKYNLVSRFLDLLLQTPDAEITSDTSLSTKLIFNTLLNKGIIKIYKQ